MMSQRERIAAGRGRVLELVDVSLSFGAVQALGGVSLEVREGEFAGLIGPNGAGKTSLFNVVSGFVRADGGRVRFAGRRVTDWGATRRARAGMGRTFQNVGLDKPATVAENLRAAQEISSLRAELAEYLSHGSAIEKRRRRERDEIVGRFELGGVLATEVHRLPMGVAKVVELACTLLRRPRLLLLDEPSSGLGPEETSRLGQVLGEMQRTHKLAILMIEHDMSLAMTLCEYLYVLDFGVLIAQGPPEVVRHDPRVLEVYLGRQVA